MKHYIKQRFKKLFLKIRYLFNKNKTSENEVIKEYMEKDK